MKVVSDQAWLESEALELFVVQTKTVDCLTLIFFDWPISAKIQPRSSVFLRTAATGTSISRWCNTAL